MIHTRNLITSDNIIYTYKSLLQFVPKYSYKLMGNFYFILNQGSEPLGQPLYKFVMFKFLCKLF